MYCFHFIPAREGGQNDAVIVKLTTNSRFTKAELEELLKREDCSQLLGGTADKGNSIEATADSGSRDPVPALCKGLCGQEPSPYRNHAPTAGMAGL